MQALNEHSNAEVHLYEVDNRPGGHANTVKFKRPDASGKAVEEVDVDTSVLCLTSLESA